MRRFGFRGTMRAWRLSWIILLVLLSGKACAQQVKADVVLHIDMLPEDEKAYLTKLDDQLKAALNSFAWTDGKYQYDLPVRVDLFFDKYSRDGIYHRYTAGVLVGLKTGIQMRDRRWDFRYIDSPAPHIGDPYDTMTGLIEFYTWICLGFEGDRIAPQGGDPFYQRAQIVSQNARGEAQYYLGWDKRRELINAFVDTTYDAIRNAAYWSEAGNYFVSNGDTAQARQCLETTANIVLNLSPSLLELRRDDHIIRFVDRTSFAANLKNLEMDDLLKRMARWDSEHADLYK
jgi:hypothetical protein